MFNRASYWKIVITLGIILIIPLTLLFASEDNSVWLDYSKAVKLFQQNGDQKEIVSLCKHAKKKANDPVLFCRISFLLADVYKTQKNYKDAHQTYQDIYKSKLTIPSSLVDETKLREGQLYLKEGNESQAIETFKVVANNDSNLFLQQEARFALAWHTANQEQWGKCDSLLSKITFTNSVSENDQRMKILEARHAISKSEAETAINLLKETQSKTGLKYLAQAYELAGKQILAVSIYKKIYDLFPDSFEAEEALFLGAKVFMKAGDWLAAKTELKRLLQLFPESKFLDSAHFQLGWIYIYLNEFDLALGEFQYKSALEFSNYFKYMEAECCRKMGKNNPEKLQDSFRLFNQISSIGIQSNIAPLAKVKAALIEMDKGDTTNALISLRQFLSLYPKSDMKTAVNFLLAVNENEEKNIKYFDNILQTKDKSEIYDAANFALQNQDFKKDNYQQIISRNSTLKNKNTSPQLNNWQRASHLLLAESAYFLKHYDLARKEYGKVEIEQTDDLAEKAAIGKAWCAFQEGNLDSSENLFKILKNQFLGINQVLAQYGLATVLFHQGNYEDALQEYSVSFKVNNNLEYEPLVAKSLYRSAECYYRLQFYTQAIETWEKLVIDYPASEFAADAKFHSADTYFRANHFSKADSSFLFVIENYPENSLAIESSLRLAQSAYNAGNYGHAVERYQSFIDEYPNHKNSKDALEGIQLSYYQLGQTEQASEILKKVVEQSSNADLSADAKYRIAENYLQEEKYQEAIEILKEILTLYPNTSYAMDAQFAIAKSFIVQKNFENGTRELLQYVQYFPNSTQLPEAFYLLGIGYYNQKSYLSAIDYFNKVTIQYPESEFCQSSILNIAWSFERLNEKESALEYFDNYLTTYPDDGETNNIKMQKAKLLVDLNRSQEAAQIFTKLQTDPDSNINTEASFRLGEIYILDNKIQEAIKAFQVAVKNGEKNNYYRLSSIAQMAAIYENNGQQQKALEAYELLANSTTDAQWIEAAKERINALTGNFSVKDKQENE